MASKEYDVFICHRGPDTKLNFVDHLYEKLKSQGIISCFLDHVEIEKGENVSEQIFKAVEAAKVYIIVFSPKFAESHWCLREVFHILEARRRDSTKTIFPVFYGVSASDVRWPDKAGGLYKKGFEELERKAYTDKKQIHEWKQALREASYLMGHEVKENTRQAESLKEITAEIIKVLAVPHLLQQDTGKVLIVDDDQAAEVISKLKVGEGDQVLSLGITGQGGIGKTTLAKRMFNMFLKNFDAVCFLSEVRQTIKDKGIDSLHLQMLHDIFRIEENVKAHAAKNWFRDRVKSTCVLIVVDDVDRVADVEELLPLELLGPGSRAIVTSRDEQVLKKLDVRYEVREMNNEDATKLFTLHAFEQHKTYPGFQNLVEQTVNACGGIPLALEIIGRRLHGVQDEDIWRAAIEKLKSNPGLITRLRISLEPLNRSEKNAFLDVSCFLLGMNKRTAVWIWESLGWKTATDDLDILLNKHLLKLDQEDILRMHDMIRDMGRQVVEEESERIWERSRIWDSNDAQAILERDKGTDRTRALTLFGSTWDAQRFQKLSELKFLNVSDCKLTGDFQSMSPDLRCLQWHAMPLDSLPPRLDLTNVVVLDISKSQVTSLWKDQQVPTGLVELILNECESLEEIAEQVGQMINLRKIHLQSCSKLVRLPGSIGKLEHLLELDVSGCEKLEQLPEFTDFSELQKLSTSRCLSLNKLHQSVGNLKHLVELKLDSTSISSLPSTFGQLTALTKLNLSNCEELTSLDDSVSGLSSLRTLDMINCGISRLPESFGQLTNLVEINLKGSKNLQELCDSFGSLINLENLVLKECSKLSKLPVGFENLAKLVTLEMGDCQLFELPENLGNLKSLRLLHLAYNKFGFLPISISKLESMENLEAHHCFVLSKIGGLGLPRALRKLGIQALRKLDIGDCYLLESLPDLGELNELEVLILCNCTKLEVIQGVGKLEKLISLNISGCTKLSKVPGLHNAKSLRELYLSGSKVILAECADWFKVLSKLQVVSYYCSILPKGYNSLLAQPISRAKDSRIVCMEESVVGGKQCAGILFMFVSHDQGWSDYEWDHGRYSGSSILEASIERSNHEVLTSTIVNNRHADGRDQLHICFFRKNHVFVEGLEAGDKVRVYARSYYQGWGISVKQASMQILYDEDGNNGDVNCPIDLSSLSVELRWQQWRYMAWNSMPCWVDVRNLAALDLTHCELFYNVISPDHRGPERMKHAQLVTENRWREWCVNSPLDHISSLGVGLIWQWLQNRMPRWVHLAALDLTHFDLRYYVPRHSQDTVQVVTENRWHEWGIIRNVRDLSSTRHIGYRPPEWEPCTGCRGDERPFFSMEISTSGRQKTVAHSISAATSKDGRIQVLHRGATSEYPGDVVYSSKSPKHVMTCCTVEEPVQAPRDEKPAALLQDEPAALVSHPLWSILRSIIECLIPV